MNVQPFFHKAALATVLASAGILLSGPVVTTHAADTAAQSKQNTSNANPGPAAAQSSYVAAQNADQLLANDLMGMNVKNGQDKDETVGKISDVILDRGGSVRGIVVGVGGFLGMGEKDVGMPWDRVQSVDTDDKVARVNASKDELKSAPEFKRSRAE